MENSILSNNQLVPNTSTHKFENDLLTQKQKDKPNTQNLIPTLKRNHKTPYIFGPSYFHSIKEAIFEMPSKPFMPEQIPESLKQSDPDLEPLFVCGQCKDCYRFSTTLEDHIARRSWILGYWCQHCFQLKCTHIPKGKSMCSSCLSAQFCKRAYLRAKGMKKGQRAAVIQIFYNQCQFFAHLKAHKILSVDLNDLMLMPIPLEVEKKDHVKLERACKSLMEYGFLHRIHIMELLKDEKPDSNWWDPPPLDSNSDFSEAITVPVIINTFRESELIEKNDQPAKKNSFANKNSPPTNKSNTTITNKNNNINIQNISSPLPNNVSVTYYHSPYRPPADIAFVDCGPSPQNLSKSNQTKSHYISSQPTKETDFFLKNKNVSGMVSNQISQNISNSPAISTSTSIASSSLNKVYTMSTSNTTTSTGPKISVKKFASEPASNWGKLGENSEKSNNQSQPSNANTKILTVHSEKCMDLSSIISQLPPDVMNSKKIVFIEQNSNQVQYQKNSHGNKSSAQMSSGPTLSANCIKVVPQRRLISTERDKNKPIPILPAVSQAKKVSQPVFNDMLKSNMSMNSGSKTKTYTVTPVTRQVLKTVPTEQKISASNFNISPSKFNVSPSKQNFSEKSSTSPSGVNLPKINSYDGRIFYQSGKKYVIKQANKIKSPSAPPTKSVLKTTSKIPNKVQTSNSSIQISNSVSYSKAKSVTKTLPKIIAKSSIVMPTISPLTPSPSPSEMSSSSSCDAQTKQTINSEEFGKTLPIQTSKNLKMYHSRYDLKKLSISRQKLLTVKYDSISRPFLHMSKNLSSMKTIKLNASKYRQFMLDSFPHLRKEQILKMIDHIKKLSEDYSMVMQNPDDEVIQKYTKLIRYLEDSIEQAKLLNITDNSDEKNKKELEADDNLDSLDNWEEQDMQKCVFCEKMKKPKNYIPAFSRLSANESRYCQCYNCMCSACNTFQGNIPRFAAHMNYHDKNNLHNCPECMRRFSNVDLLEKHVWLYCFHPIVKNWMFGCNVCGIDGLTTIESLTKHFLVMHSERGFVCSDCKRFFRSLNECNEHQESEHQNEIFFKNGENRKVSKNVSETVEIIMCRVGQCIVLKENFQSHLYGHIGVEEQIFYKCPFCPFNKRANVQLFREHMFSNHSHVLQQYTNPSVLSTVQETLKKQKTNEQKTHEPVLPMIINTRTIAQEAFEKGTQDEESQDNQSLSNEKLDSGMPMIIDVRSEAVELNSIESNADSMPKILEVKSIANDSSLKETSFESRKRKSSAVIEITFSPEQISSTEVVNGKVDQKLSEVESNETGNSTVMKKNSIVEEKSLEKENSVSRENTTAENKFLVCKENSTLQENSSLQEISISHDNSVISNEISAIPAENLEETKKNMVSVNALEDLKAKMSRTFKTLARKMEASKTTLQQECSKTLPKLKNILEAEDNISKGDFNNGIEERVRISENDDLDENRLEEISVPDEKLKTDLVQLPPLSRIPEYLLNYQPIVDEEQTTKKSRKRKRIDKIAFNGPVNSEEIVLDFKCHVCSKMIDSSWSVLKSHFNIWHQDEYKVSILNPQLLRISSDYIEGGYKEVLAKKYKSDLSPRKRRKRTRFAAKIAEKASMDNSAGICVTTESVKEDDGTFKCKKCDLKCSDMGSLREHISKSHRIKGRYLICLECGENFVVAPSLQMHLKAFHAIDDPLTYLLQNTAFAPENMDDTEEEEEEVTTEANQCYVCMAVFEDKAAVDKHLRVHGMAFLHRKRIEAKKSLNSPEKKIKIGLLAEVESQNDNVNLSLDKLQEEKQVETAEDVVTNSIETEVPVH